MNLKSTDEICVAIGASRNTLSNRIKKGLFPLATHRRGARHYWDIDLTHISNAIEDMKGGRLPLCSHTDTSYGEGDQ